MTIFKKNGYLLNMQKIELSNLGEGLTIKGIMIGKSICMNLQKDS